MRTSNGYLYESRADEALASARVLHLAEGILMGLRAVSSEVALAELIDVAHSAQLSPFTVAEALVYLVGGDGSRPQSPTAALVVERWGDLLPAASPSATSESG